MPVTIPLGYAQYVARILTPANKVATFTIGGSIVFGADLQDAVNFADDATRDVWNPLTDSGYTWQPGFMYEQTGTGLSLAVSTLGTLAGAASSNSAPTNCSYILRKRTAFVGKSFRGRCYLPIGVGEGNVDEGGRLTAGTMSTYQTALNSWFNRMTNAANQPFSDAYLFRSESPEAVAITSMDLAPIIGTQRRRLVRGA